MILSFLQVYYLHYPQNTENSVVNLPENIKHTTNTEAKISKF